MNSEYNQYLRKEVQLFESQEASIRSMLVDALAGLEVRNILDIGCGAGQAMLPIIEKGGVFGVGIDIASEVGDVGRDFFSKFDLGQKVRFIRAAGERLPVADGSMDVVICRIALPYMENSLTIGEISRVLRPQGVFFVKIHAPAFYAGMLRQRLRTFSPKQLAYPLIAITGSVFYSLTGHQLQSSFWKGREIFRTTRSLRRQLAGHGLSIIQKMPDTSIAAPSFKVVKD